MVVVFNFGGQYAHLIARRIRELGIKSELVNPNITPEKLINLSPDAIIFSGSPFSVYTRGAPKINPKIFKLKIPILGICYGQQLIAHLLGGKVKAHETKQFGKETITVNKSPLFKNLAKKETVWFSHGDRVEKIPRNFEIIASTGNVKIAGIQNLKNNIFAIQFHPEVTHTKNGMKVLENFLFSISNAKKDWKLTEIKKQIIVDLKNQIKTEKVIMAISGGVDSLVASVVLKEAIAGNLYLIFIDTGLLRKNEVQEVQKIVKAVGFINIKTVSASNRFLKVLKNVVDPEEKRKAIAKLYFRIFEEEAKKINNASPTSKQVKYLGQGTIYPDRIESAQTSKHADKIKSHHNVTLPAGLSLQIVEPLADFYKDEVRKLGKILKIDNNFLNRHPFPGPGLAIRILANVTKERLTLLREADAIFIEELKRSNLYSNIGQALVALFPIKSVGVMGDSRTYSYIVSLRSVDTTDFMTADWSKLPTDFLEKVSSRIVNEVRGINRVVYDITQKPPATIEYE